MLGVVGDDEDTDEGVGDCYVAVRDVADVAAPPGGGLDSHPAPRVPDKDVFERYVRDPARHLTADRDSSTAAHRGDVRVMLWFAKQIEM